MPNYISLKLCQIGKPGIPSLNLLSKSAWNLLKHCKINRIRSTRKGGGAGKHVKQFANRKQFIRSPLKGKILFDNAVKNSKKRLNFLISNARSVGNKMNLLHFV